MPVGERVGRPVRQCNATRRYVDSVKETTGVRLDGLHVVLDCAQGASYEVAPMVFRELGADVGFAFDEDADRLMAVDERGQLINGDQVMVMLALYLKEQGRLRQNTADILTATDGTLYIKNQLTFHAKVSDKIETKFQ